MSQEMTKSPTPICLIVSKIPLKETQNLKDYLATAWSSMTVEPPFVKDFHFLPWSKILGSDYKLRQIHHLVQQTSIETGRSTCLVLDAMSGLSKVVYLAQYNENDAHGPSVRIGTINHIRDAPQCLMDWENGLQNSKAHSSIYVRDPELPVESRGEQGARVSKDSYPQFGTFSKGAGITEPILPILCTVKFDQHSLEQFQSKLNQTTVWSKSSYVLVPWETPEKASRAAMYKAATQALNGDMDTEEHYRYLMFLDTQTMADNSMLLARFVNIDHTGGNDPLRRRLLLGRIPINALPSFREAFEKNLVDGRPTTFLDDFMQLDNFMQPGAYEEEIWNPDCPLSVRKPLYLHQGSRPDTPTFFLAKLAEEDEAMVKKELETPCDYDASDDAVKRFNYVPWAGEEDVTEEEIKTHIPRYMSYLTERSGYSVTEALFVDAESPRDGKVIAASCKREISDPRLYRLDKEKLVEIYWGRKTMQQAQSACTNLRIANVSWDELFMDMAPGVIVSKEERGRLAELGRVLAEGDLWG